MNYKTGAYVWENTINGMVYVGGAYKSFDERRDRHKKDLVAGCHFNQHLQRAWNKYGGDAFVFRIVERCHRLKVQVVEQKWLDHYGVGTGRSYNMNAWADRPPSALGLKRSEETKKRMSESLLGNTNCRGFKHGRLFRELASRRAKERFSNPKVAAAAVRHLHTPSVKKKARQRSVEAIRKKMLDPAARAAMSESCKVRMTVEVRKSLSDKAKQQWSNPSTRRKMLRRIRAANSNPEFRRKRSRDRKELWKDPEFRRRMVEAARDPIKRAKLSAAGRGRKFDQATRDKIAASVRASWALRRAKS